ncbi:hypothetical protein [Legionella micdadei]|uniref:Uncharacterized protein n=1 Tax=Legionella micdadei TaxID=451 RepID=A0A098GH27_LEGMI|nr:hypothetical protein [Legionella micdadei]ARG96838.1 hypothetical protein B6N58_03695 [Legionella micdadei]KTD26518.1 hypothetical protein Lmic_2612 [Legionella micdadei]NSL17892.1 hypothetical protein [Legionella micdadei]CEG61764.1 protein of unknown function [Legionella micdadei]SCY22784.1 hypothetical protein SAMN02982997_01140 [Legionella micdadei]
MFLHYIREIESVLEYARREFSLGRHKRANFALKDVFGLLTQQNYYSGEIEFNHLHGDQQFAVRLDSAIHDYCDLINKVYFAQSYHLLARCNDLIVKGDLQQAALLLHIVKSYANNLQKFYLTALHNGLASTPAYIDFPKDFDYLKRYIHKSAENFNLTLLSDKLVYNIMHFKDNQSALGLNLPFRGLTGAGSNRYSQFSPSTVPATASAEDRVETEQIDHDLGFNNA